MRVLFTTMPGEGHFNPLVPLAQALSAAGHEVAFTCAPRFRPTIEARGFRVFTVGPDWLIADKWVEQWPQLRELSGEQAMTFIWADIFAGDVAERTLADILALACIWPPDVIVREMTEFGGWLAAETLGLPHATVEVTLFRFYADYASPIAASLTRILERAGQPPHDVPMRLFANLHLSFVPPSYQDPNAPPPATTHALRPLLLDPLPGEHAPPWLASLPDRPTVYATGGTNGDRTSFFEAVIAPVRGLDVNLVATIGRQSDPAKLGSQPENVHVAGYISQALLLPHCDVVMTHGGFSSVLGALACGVPLVIMPLGADHPVNARRAVALGAAIALDADQRTPEAIRAAVQTVLADPAYRECARRVQAEIAALPGPERGVELLEQLVARHATATIA